MRLLTLFVVTTELACAQLINTYRTGGLATTYDGAHLYFSSSLRLKGTSQSPYPKIFRWTRERGFELIVQEQPEGVPGNRTINFYRLL